MIGKLLGFKGIAIVVGLVAIIFAVRWAKSFTIIKKEVIENYEADKIITSKNISILSDELKIKSDTIFAKQQEIDVQATQLRQMQIITAELNKSLVVARNEAKKANDAIEHYEVNGLMRFFVFDPKGIFKKGCFQEVFEKPENICK